jgi:hypothetical protein
MAGVKVTDLTPLATAASDDIFYIVDTSSNTSKQIEVQNIYDGMPQLESGVYTPAVSGNTNGVVVNIAKGFYSRVGTIVTVSFFLDVQLDTGETTGSFNLDLPIASNFSNDKDYTGTIWYKDPSELLGDSYAQSDGANQKISVFLVSNTTAFNYIYLTITGQYEIL